MTELNCSAMGNTSQQIEQIVRLLIAFWRHARGGLLNEYVGPVTMFRLVALMAVVGVGYALMVERRNREPSF